MNFVVEGQHLEAIWNGLSRPLRRRNPSAADHRAEQIAKTGWADRPDIEDLLTDMDDRLWDVSKSDLVAAFAIPRRYIYQRPRRIATSAFAHQSVAATDLARLLILLERLGFAIDPTLLVNRLFPLVSAQQMLTESDLDIFWFAKLRHKSPPLMLTLKERPTDPVGSQTEVQTTTGYKATAYRDTKGQLWMIQVRAPKYRRQPRPHETECKECGVTWLKGDPESSADHRRKHAKRMAIIQPTPHERFLRAVAEEVEPELVINQSPTWKHREMYLRAAQFRREFGYDFVQWDSPRDADPNVHGRP